MATPETTLILETEGGPELTPEDREAARLARESPAFRELWAKLDALCQAKGIDREDRVRIVADPECARVVKDLLQYFRYFEQQGRKREKRRAAFRKRSFHDGG